MSYILDALQRAEAERERGAIPGLHAQPIAATPHPSLRHNTQRWWIAAMAAALALGLTAIGWMRLTSPNTPAPDQPQQAAIAKIPAPVPTAQTSVPQPPSPPAAVAPPAPKPTPAPAPLPARPEPPPAKTVEKTAPPPPGAPLLGELPEDFRHQIPPLSIGGAVYSDNPEQRVLLVNGQVLNQGSTVTPELTLVEIQPKSSLFSFRGTRFRVAH